MQPGVSPPRLDELLSPGRRFAFGLGLLAVHFILGGSELWGFLPDPLPMTVGPVLTLVTALLLARWLGVSLTGSFAYHWPQPTQIGWAALGGLAFVLPSRILGAINTQLIEPADWYVEAMESLQPETSADWIAHVLLVVVLVPLAEETVFRGVLQPAADSVFGPASSAVIIGVMFGLFHFQPWFLLPLAVIGMMLGLTRWITGSVISCTVVHGAYNLGSIALGEWMRRGSEYGETFSTLAAGVLTLGALFSAWLCWAALGRLRPVQSGEESGTSPD